MNKEQEGKFDRFYEDEGKTMGLKFTERRIWAECCKANGINTEEPVFPRQAFRGATQAV